MDDDEHERWRRHLEEELEAAFDQVRAGFRAQMRILGQVRAAARLREERPPTPAPALSAPLPQDGTPHPQPSPVPAPAPPPNPAPAQKRRRAGEVFHQMVAALDELPEEFAGTDLLARLDPRPRSATYHQNLGNLERAGYIERIHTETGGYSGRFRQLPSDDAEPS